MIMKWSMCRNTNKIGVYGDSTAHATRHIIAQDQSRKVDVRPIERYHFEDMVGYALHVTEEVDMYKPYTYMDVEPNAELEK